MIDELRCFVLVVEEGTFTAAARAAGLSQPSLSAAIARLEHWHDARLFHRLPRPVRLTTSGAALLPHARAALGAVASGQRAVAEVEGVVRGSVTVAGGAAACTYLLPEPLVSFRRAHPGVRLHVRQLATPDVPLAVARGEVDLGIAEGEGEPCWVDELVMIGLPGARWPAPVVAFAAGTSLRALLEACFPQAELAMELGSFAGIKGMVRAGMGVALLSRGACAEELATGAFVSVELPPSASLPLRRELGLLHLGLKRLSPAARALRQTLLASAS